MNICGENPAHRKSAERSPFTKVQRIKNENK